MSYPCEYPSRNIPWQSVKKRLHSFNFFTLVLGCCVSHAYLKWSNLDRYLKSIILTDVTSLMCCLYLTHRMFSVVLFYQIMTIFLIYYRFSFHPSFLGSYSSRMLTTTCNMMDRANIEKAIFWGFWVRVFSVSDSKMWLSLKTLYNLWNQWVIFDSQLLNNGISKTLFRKLSCKGS